MFQQMVGYKIIDNVLHITNNGYDRDEKPFIPLGEYLQDVAQVVNKQMFISVARGMYNDEISKLPEPMKRNGLTTIMEFIKNYDEWKNISKIRFGTCKDF